MAGNTPPNSPEPDATTQPESVSSLIARHGLTGQAPRIHRRGRAMDLWLQLLFAIILIGIAIELAYIGRALGTTNRLLGALLRHIKPG